MRTWRGYDGQLDKHKSGSTIHIWWTVRNHGEWRHHSWLVTRTGLISATMPNPRVCMYRKLKREDEGWRGKGAEPRVLFPIAESSFSSGTLPVNLWPISFQGLGTTFSELSTHCCNSVALSIHWQIDSTWHFLSLSLLPLPSLFPTLTIHRNMESRMLRNH